jgi:ClpP class serine protease
MNSIPSLFNQLTSEAWYIGGAAHSILLAIHGCAEKATALDGDISKALSMAFSQRKPMGVEKETGIARISMFGPLARNLAPLQRATGMTDFAQLHEDFSAAGEQGAKGILLLIDSPGGTVNGTPEGAAVVAESKIPVVVHASRAGSAAYYIASGARRIVADPSAEMGSIGVMMPRVDLSEALKRSGIRADVIVNTGGDLKAISAATE